MGLISTRSLLPEKPVLDYDFDTKLFARHANPNHWRCAASLFYSFAFAIPLCSLLRGASFGNRERKAVAPFLPKTRKLRYAIKRISKASSGPALNRKEHKRADFQILMVFH